MIAWSNVCMPYCDTPSAIAVLIREVFSGSRRYSRIVGVLTQDVPEPFREARRVETDLPLGDGAALVPEEELHRILDRDDVLRVAPVERVDHGGEGSRLAAPNRAADQNEPAGTAREVL